jgi:hypothetical protein
MTMAFCGSCGSPLQEGIKFCGTCGAVVPGPGDETPMASAEAPVVGTAAGATAVTQAAAADAAATSPLPPAEVTTPMPPVDTTTPMPPVDATVPLAVPPPSAPVGADFAPQPYAGQWAAQPGAYPPAGVSAQAGVLGGAGGPPAAGSRKGTFTLIAVAIVVVALIALIATAFLTAGDGEKSSESKDSSGGTAATSASPSPGGSDLTDQVLALLAPVSEAQSNANDAVAAAEATEESLAEVQAAGEALTSAVSAADDAAGDLDPESEADQVIVTALRTGLSALGEYGDALAGLPDTPDGLTPAAATAVAAAGQEATDALEGFATVGGPTTAAMAEGLVPPEGYDRFQTLAGGMAQDEAMKAYLAKVEDLLEKSGDGREALVKAVNGINGRTMDPESAGTLTDTAYENRTAILKKVKALKPPADARARQVRKHFQNAMALSLKADTAYAYWVLYAHDEYYSAPEGYKGPVELTADYKAGVRWSTRASAAKAKLLKVYNKLAQANGLKHDWTTEDI